MSNQNRRIQQEEAYLAKFKQIKKRLMHDLLTGEVRVRVEEEVEFRIALDIHGCIGYPMQ